MKFPRVRPGRTIISIAIIGSALWGLAPSLSVTPSIDAVVNAEVVVVRSVIEGQVVGGPPEIGKELGTGAFLARVVNPRQDRSFLGELQTELASLTQRLAALDRQKRELEETAGILTLRVHGYRDSMEKSLEYRVAEAKGDLTAIDASLNRARQELTRRTALIAKDLVTQSSFDETRSEVGRLEGQRSAAENRLREFELRLSSVRDGTFLSDGQNDVPYSQQRLDEITMRTSDLDARRSEYAIRANEITHQIAVEMARLDATREMSIEAPVSGLVWKRFVKPGNEVVIGTELVELVDCNSVFLDATFDEDRVGDIRIGQKAKVRFVGSDEKFDATVRAIRGSGAVTEDRLLAARTKPRGSREFQAILEFDAQSVGSSAANFCLIGRSAEIAFASDLPGKTIHRVFQAASDLVNGMVSSTSSSAQAATSQSAQ